MNQELIKTCHFCQSNQPRKSWFGCQWVEERQYLEVYGRILKEILVGGAESSEKERIPINTVYYCSFTCS